MRRSASLEVAALCVVWYSLSSAANVAGALLLAEMPRPLTAALAQLVAGAVLSALAVRLSGGGGGGGAGSLPRRLLWALAALKLSTTALSHLSLWRVPVSYAHTVKATTPLWTALLSWVVLGERQSRGVVGALALIAAGVALASATEMRFDAGGLGAALGAAALLSAQHVYSKRALGPGVPPLVLLRELAARAALGLSPLWAWADAAALISEGMSQRAAALLAADALLAWLQALAALAVLWRVSPLAYGVASAAKRAAVVLASLVVLRNPAPPLNLAGMALAALGVLAYNRTKARHKVERRPLLPV